MGGPGTRPRSLSRWVVESWDLNPGHLNSKPTLSFKAQKPGLLRSPDMPRHEGRSPFSNIQLPTGHKAQRGSESHVHKQIDQVSLFSMVEVAVLSSRIGKNYIDSNISCNLIFLDVYLPSFPKLGLWVKNFFLKKYSSFVLSYI